MVNGKSTTDDDVLNLLADSGPLAISDIMQHSAVTRTAVHERLLRLMSEGLNASPGVTYARYGDRTLEMDIYRPNNAWGKLPAVRWHNQTQADWAALKLLLPVLPEITTTCEINTCPDIRNMSFFD